MQKSLDWISRMDKIGSSLGIVSLTKDVFSQTVRSCFRHLRRAYIPIQSILLILSKTHFLFSALSVVN